MPPFAAELEEWWLTSGHEILTRLLDPNNDLNPQECGFAQDVQRKLRALDNDPALQAEIKAAWPAIRSAKGINYGANPRKHLKEASSNIFRHTGDGGIDRSRLLDGLGYLDAMEFHRLRLMKATKSAMETTALEKHQAQLVDELDHHASTHYRRFHMVFRICALIEDLTKSDEETLKLMARLNALFPPFVVFQDEGDIDPTPYSPGLRDSIRFSVFEYLMRGKRSSDHQKLMIQMKLFGFCDNAGYAEGRDALSKYCEESKKLEQSCLAILHDLAQKSPIEMYGPTSSTESSYLSTEGSVPSLVPSGTSPKKATPDVTTSGDASFDSQHSSVLMPPTPSVTIASNPLLKGMPGREISPAKTDCAAFTRDKVEPPVLCYPKDLSETDFCQHPLAKELDLSPLEMSILGLLIPQEVNKNENVASSNSKASKRSKRSKGAKRLRKLMRRQAKKEEIPPVPPLPPIEEIAAKSAKFIKKMQSRSNPDDPTLPEELSTKQPPAKKDASGTLKLGKKNRRPAMKVQISDPGHVPETGTRNLCARPQSDMIPIVTDGKDVPKRFSHPRDGPKMKYELAKPRLSPMEYARMYLIEKALAERENRPCELPRMKEARYWSPRWDKFLIIPRIPHIIRRDLGVGGGNNGGSTLSLTNPEFYDSDNESVITVKVDAPASAYPRLSLHLDDLPDLSPLMDLHYDNVSDAISSLNTGLPEVETEATAQSDESTPHDGGEITVPRTEQGLHLQPEQGSPPDKEDEQEKHQAIGDVISPPVTGSIYANDLPEEPAMIIHHDQPHQRHEKQEFWRKVCKDGEASTSSPLSEASAETALYTEKVMDQFLATPDPSTRKSSGKRPQPFTEDFSSVDFTNPGPKIRVIDYSSVQPNTSPETSTPMAHFPIAAQQTSRLTPSTLARYVIGGAGGFLRPEDARKARLAQSVSVVELPKFPQASSAHFWSTASDSSSIISELQPEPLRLGRRVSQPAEQEESQRPKSSRDFNTGGDGEPKDDMQDLFDMVDLGQMQSEAVGVSGDEGALETMKSQLSIVGDSPTIPKALLPSSSTAVSPKQSWNTIESESTFNVAEDGPSGFTPRHNRDYNSSPTLPQSPTMGNRRNLRPPE
ncbi:hypothetical protein EDB81DRAFT_883816 [Dactylonectria macrodidyma]|uniref:Uncharacterized protein n=1 Tax=Dactylonectria macrodidyma TaxID=307937 RepID=A0A9P9EXF6_9HYPO|nr:hypothetical protein EDB81DRAFT_883816 [Dactylonectria macrodidyma]